jgi:hypothetical protein
MQNKHGPFDLGVDPGLLAIRAAGDDSGKIPVMSDGEAAGTERSAKRA